MVFTPEQAIAATLGRGTLTAEQVRKCVRIGACDHGLWGALDEDTDWQAIADELNAALGRGECELTLDGTDGCFGCSECFENIPPLANFCPNCGKRIRKAVKR